MSELPVIPMDDAAYWQNPYPILGEIRAEHRVAQSDQGQLTLLRWDDAVETLKGTQFIAEGIEVLERRGFKPGDPMHTWRKNAIGTMEGEDHRRVRSLAASALSKRRMEELRPLIRKHAHALLDEKVGAGRLEGRLDYAMPLPRRVMMDFLGVEPAELASAQGPMAKANIVDCFGPNVTAQLREEANAAIKQSMEQTAALYALRRKEPRDDLLTHLVEANEANGQLSEGELITLFSTIFGSGGSTSNVIASGLLELARHPDQAQRLRDDPERWKKGASEETLRFRPSITYVGQKSAEATHAFGLDFPAETPLAVNLGSCNRDTRYWEDPERFDITRDPKKTSLTFGIGAHVCIGHAMARATVEEALAVFVERCDEIELVGDARWIPFVMENKLEGLALGFSGQPVG
ncbi:MAG: cytochrome P450 [Myxococcota bacterium]